MSPSSPSSSRITVAAHACWIPRKAVISLILNMSNMIASSGRIHRPAVSSPYFCPGPKNALIAQAASDLGDVAFALAQRIRRGVHRVVAGYQFVGMLDGRAEHERRVGQRFELDRLVAFLEHGGFAGRNLRWRCDPSLMRRDPCDVMIPRRLEHPTLSGTQANIEIGHALRRSNETFDSVIFAPDDARRARRLESRCIEILALRLGKFERRRHRHPQLKTLDTIGA